MATFAPPWQIEVATVEAEKARLLRFGSGGAVAGNALETVVDPQPLGGIDNARNRPSWVYGELFPSSPIPAAQAAAASVD